MTYFGAGYSCLPLPGLHQHLASCGVAQAYEKIPAGAASGGPWGEVEQECAVDPALAELRQHLQRHSISFVVFDMDLTVTAKHTRGHLARDPDVMAGYLESARATDALKVRNRERGRKEGADRVYCLARLRCAQDMYEYDNEYILVRFVRAFLLAVCLLCAAVVPHNRN